MDCGYGHEKGGDDKAGAWEEQERRTYGSLELSGTSYIVDLHIDFSVILGAVLSVSIPMRSEELLRIWKRREEGRNASEELKRWMLRKMGTWRRKRLTSSLIIGICSSLYASNAALNRRWD